MHDVQLDGDENLGVGIHIEIQDEGGHLWLPSSMPSPPTSPDAATGFASAPEAPPRGLNLYESAVAPRIRAR